MAEKPEKEEEHLLLPGHFLVDEKDASALLEKLNAAKENLPGILKMDPAIKKLKAKRGDIIRLERNSPTAGKTTYYRVVR
ncbi:MAG: DNA-directed RNA polymerase subunit H [Candidatus Diapherotrites archaeon]|nr:DNA-directed RNA polymerase subunit H [Candidatus Diapherotrites archaeon]